jgi:amino acid transporter
VKETNGHASPVEWTVKVSFVSALLLLNFLGIESVGRGSSAFMTILLAPWILVVVIAITGGLTGTTITGWPFNTASAFGTRAISTIDWSRFLMVLLWNMGDWEGASVCAGEVENVSRVFPSAISIAFFVVMANYMLPIVAFSGLDANYAAYNNGHYIQIARNVCGPYLGCALGIAQTISICGLFAQSVLKNTYMICGMSEQGLLPAVFGRRCVHKCALLS